MGNLLLTRVCILILLSVVSFVQAKEVDSWDANLYQKTMKSQSQDGDWLMSFIDEEADSHLTILDIGSGNGVNTQKLCTKFPNAHVIGIDPSASMIATANQQIGDSNVEYIKTTLEDFDHMHEIFDIAVSIHTLHWLNDIKKGLENTFNALKEEGCGYFLFAASKEGLPYQNALDHVLNGDLSPDFKNFVNPQHIYSFADFETLLKEAGFVVNWGVKKLNTRIYPTPEELSAWIAQWSPHRKHLPEDKQAKFMDQLLKEYLKKTRVKDLTGVEYGVKWEEYILMFIVMKPSRPEGSGDLADH